MSYSDKVANNCPDVYKVKLNKSTIRLVVKMNGTLVYYKGSSEKESYKKRTLIAVNKFIYEQENQSKID